jgi:hypothetical protein
VNVVAIQAHGFSSMRRVDSFSANDVFMMSKQNAVVDQKVGQDMSDRFSYGRWTAFEEEQLRQLIARDPNALSPRYYLMFFLVANGQHAVARKECLQILSLDPKNFIGSRWKAILNTAVKNGVSPFRRYVPPTSFRRRPTRKKWSCALR